MLEALAFIFFIVFVFAIIGVFRPYRSLPKWKRGHYIALSVVSFLVVGLAAPEQQKKPDAPSPSTPTAGAKDATKADAIALFKKLIEVVGPCDKAASLMATQVQSNNVVDAYRAADQTEGVCLGVPGDIREISIPDSFDDATHEAAKKAIDACERTYLAKWDGAKKLKAALDGDMRPSVAAAIEDNAKVVQSGGMLCAGGLIAIAVGAGATSKELGIPDDTSGKK